MGGPPPHTEYLFRDYVSPRTRFEAFSRPYGLGRRSNTPEKVSGWLVTAARSEPAGIMYRETALRLTAGLLDRPIGTPAHWLPEAAPRRIEEAMSKPVWQWLQTQVPTVVQQIDVARRVEQKVLDFPTAKMEDLVRRVTDRELKLIVWLGYVLGAFIGIALVIMNTLLP